MQVKIFSIPIPFSEPHNEEMNAFLRSKRVLSVDSELSRSPEGSYWVFCVRYLEGAESQSTRANKPDYRELLSEAEFKRFSAMREVRKRMSTQEGVPAYQIFTDEELAGIARISPLTLEAFRSAKGVGDKKAEKYAAPMLEAVHKTQTTPTTT